MSDTTIPPNDPAALAEQNARLLGEKKAVQARLQVLEAAARAAGIDPSTPETFLEQRESATRAARERETKVRDSVMFRLLEAGVPVAPKVVSGIIAAALADPDVKIGEDGSASGAVEHVDSWLSVLKAQAPKDQGRVPRKPDAPVRTGPENFAQLVSQGPAAVRAFAEQRPEDYERLKRAHDQGYATPRRYPTG